MGLTLPKLLNSESSCWLLAFGRVNPSRVEDAKAQKLLQRNLSSSPPFENRGCYEGWATTTESVTGIPRHHKAGFSTTRIVSGSAPLRNDRVWGELMGTA